jgi:adenine phosphoribosyltransferase
MSGDALAGRVRHRVRDVPDFPTPGILFRDIAPVLADGALFRDVIAHFAERYRGVGADSVVAIESRGFIVGAPLAVALGIGFTIVRKPGKLPWTTLRVEYALEYGIDALEAHADALGAGHRALVVDDVLATGGTASAAVDLVRKLGAEVVGCAFVIELAGLAGRERLAGVPVDSILVYD